VNQVIGRGVDKCQQWYGELVTVELVELESAVIDEGVLARGLAGVCWTKLNGTVKLSDKIGRRAL
jgi:hypothetical protein